MVPSVFYWKWLEYMGIDSATKNLLRPFIILHKCGCKIVNCLTQLHEVELDQQEEEVNHKDSAL